MTGKGRFSSMELHAASLGAVSYEHIRVPSSELLYSFPSIVESIRAWPGSRRAVGGR
jgi:hypothetical protein